MTKVEEIIHEMSSETARKIVRVFEKKRQGDLAGMTAVLDDMSNEELDIFQRLLDESLSEKTDT